MNEYQNQRIPLSPERVTGDDLSAALIASTETVGTFMEWHPIETAPMGEEILVRDELGNVCTARQYLNHKPQWFATTFGEVAFTRHGGDADPIEPTHWMPLPPPPKEKARAKAG